jgi:hypothetical protein
MEVHLIPRPLDGTHRDIAQPARPAFPLLILARDSLPHVLPGNRRSVVLCFAVAMREGISGAKCARMSVPGQLRTLEKVKWSESVEGFASAPVQRC